MGSAMRRIVLPVVLSLVALAAFGGSAPAQAAQQNAAQCEAMLDDVEIARLSLDQMEVTLTELETESADLEQRILELQVEIRFAKVGGNASLAKKLGVQLETALQDRAAVEQLRPDIAAQVNALRDSVAATERQYIQCVESLIGG